MDPTYGGGDFQAALVVDPTDRSHLYVFTGRQNPKYVIPGPAFAFVSTDSGFTFSPPVPESGPRQHPQALHSPAVGPHGTLYDAYVDNQQLADGSHRGALDVVSSADRGKTFSSPTSVTTVTASCAKTAKFCPRPIPTSSLASGTKAGQLFAVWSELSPQPRPTGGAGSPSPAEQEIYFASSRDRGLHWTVPKMIGSPSAAPPSPTVSVAVDGRLDVAAYAVGADKLQDVYLMSSVDGGSTFSAPLKVDSAPSNRLVSPASGFGVDTFRTIPLISDDGAVLVAWTDSRRGTVVNAKQDVAFDRVLVTYSG